jgi:hypothetical protein
MQRETGYLAYRITTAELINTVAPYQINLIRLVFAAGCTKLLT